MLRSTSKKLGWPNVPPRGTVKINNNNNNNNIEFVYDKFLIDIYAECIFKFNNNNK